MYVEVYDRYYFFFKFQTIIYSSYKHRERRKYLKSTLKELGLIFTDQPGLLGPKVSFVLGNGYDDD